MQATITDKQHHQFGQTFEVARQLPFPYPTNHKDLQIICSGNNRYIVLSTQVTIK